MFDNQGQAPPEEEKKSSNREQREWPRVSYKFRFKLPWAKDEEQSRCVVFLDDFQAYSADQNRALSILGAPQGPLNVKEHRCQLPDRAGKMNWNNYFIDCSAMPLRPYMRLHHMKGLGIWKTVGKFLDAAIESGDFNVMDTVYNNEVMDVGNILSEKQSDYCSDLIDLPLNSCWPNPLNNMKETKTTKAGEEYLGVKWPSRNTAFRTVVDLNSYSRKDGTVVENPVTLYACGGAAATRLASAQSSVSEGKFGKSRPTLSCYKYRLIRSKGEKTAAVGDSMELQDDLTLKQLQELSPDSVISLSPESVLERLTADNHFRYHMFRALQGSNITVEAAAKELCTMLGIKKKAVLFPHTADYMSILLPKPPRYLDKVFGLGDDNPSDEDIPF